MRWASDRHGQCFYVGVTWSSFTGQTAADVAGRGWLTVVHPDDAEYITEFLKAARSSGFGYEMRYRLRAKDGAWWWAETRAAPSVREDGQTLAGYVGTTCPLWVVEDSPVKACASLGGRSPRVKIVDHLLAARMAAARIGAADHVAGIDLALLMVSRRPDLT